MAAIFGARYLLSLQREGFFSTKRSSRTQRSEYPMIRLNGFPRQNVVFALYWIDALEVGSSDSSLCTTKKEKMKQLAR